MTSIRIKTTEFTGLSKVYSREPTGLSAILRGLAIDNARIALEKSAVAQLTDSSTGTAAAALVLLPLPSTAIDATSAGGALTSALTTSLGKQSNALQVLTRSVNNARGRLGMSRITNAVGSQASANVIPAQDLAGSAGNGASAVSMVSARSAFAVLQSNFAIVAKAVDAVFVALGYGALALKQGQLNPPISLSVATVPALASVAVGPGALAIADATAFLAAFANNVATLAAYWNRYLLAATTVTTITDSTGGTAAAALAVNATPAAVDGAATTSAPKAGFDTQLALINNVCASLATTINILAYQNGIAPLTISSTGTVSTTLAAESVSLTAVDGSSGTVAVDQASARARMATIDNNLSSLGSKINELAAVLDVVPLGTDALAGTVSSTIANVAATATGTSGVGATLLNTAVNTWLTANRNNISTLAAVLDTMVGASAPVVGLHVIAG